MACGGTTTGPDAGSGRKPIVASDYDQSCTSASDCVEIRTGDPCTSCCPTTAINVKDREKYLADLNAPICSTTTGCTCIAFTVVCQGGKCTLGGPDLDAGATDE
jgi:hypothetical protein